MNNIILLLLCLMIGALLRKINKIPKDSHISLNNFVIYISLPATVLSLFREIELNKEIVLAVVMPWILFLTACAFFWCIGKTLNFHRSTTGALMLVGGLANTSFVGLPMIEAFYGTADLPIGILIDQLGTYLVLSTLGIAVAAYYGGSSVSSRDMAIRIVTFPPLIALVLSGLLLNVAFPAWLDDVLARLSVTLVPLALVSVVPVHNYETSNWA